MKPYTKAAIYVSLAMLEPVSKAAALCVEKAAWPNMYELVALGVSMIYLALLTLKAWSSDPERPAKTPL